MAYHTDQFLIQRQNDPKWHNDYVQRMQENQWQHRQRVIDRADFWIGFLVTFFVGWWIADYFFGMALWSGITSLF